MSIVALYVEWQVYERACISLIWAFLFRHSFSCSSFSKFLNVLNINFLSYYYQTGLWKYNIQNSI